MMVCRTTKIDRERERERNNQQRENKCGKRLKKIERRRKGGK